MKALTAEQVEDAQMALRDITSKCDRLALDIVVLRIEYRIPSDVEAAKGIQANINQIQDRLDDVKGMLK